MNRQFRDELGIASALTFERRSLVKYVIPVGNGTNSNMEVSTCPAVQRRDI